MNAVNQLLANQTYDNPHDRVEDEKRAAEMLRALGLDPETTSFLQAENADETNVG